MKNIVIFRPKSDPSGMTNGGGGPGGGPGGPGILVPDYQSYSGTPAHVAALKLRTGGNGNSSNMPLLMSESEIKAEILRKQLICHAQVGINNFNDSEPRSSFFF